MKIKRIVLLLMLTLLFVGFSYATDVSNDTTTNDKSIADTTDSVMHSNNMPIKEEDNTLTDNTKSNNMITKHI